MQQTSIRVPMRRISIITGFIISFLLFHAGMGSSPSFADQPIDQNEYILKSVFLERFCRFIEWPSEAGLGTGNAPFIIGVIGDSALNSILADVYARQSIKEKRVRIRHLTSVDEIHTCHLLFIAETDHEILKAIINNASNFPVLTVADSSGYGSYGVHINMFVEHEQIRFEINSGAFKKSGLSVSSLLLKVAKLVQTVEEEQ